MVVNYHSPLISCNKVVSDAKMEHCNKTSHYPHQRDKYFHIGAVSLTLVNLLGFGVNCFTFCFIIANQILRRKNICSAKLLAVNTTECISVCAGLLAVKHVKNPKLDVATRKYYVRLIYFFTYGQLTAIGLITMGRIKLANSPNITLNTMSKNPSDKIYQSRTLVAIFCTICINLALTLMVKDLQLIVMGVLVVLDLTLFVILVLELSKIKAIVHGNIVNVRKRALSYVSILMAGFILDMIILFALGALVRKNLHNNCPVLLDPPTLIAAQFRAFMFLWDPVSYFLFNSLPRNLLKQRCRKWRN